MPVIAVGERFMIEGLAMREVHPGEDCIVRLEIVGLSFSEKVVELSE